MAPPDEIMSPVPKAEALVQAEIHAMRQVADAISQQGKQVAAHMEAGTRALERLSEKVDGMNERLIRLEEQKHGREIERLTREMGEIHRALVRRIDDLESTRDQQKGARALVDWLRQTAPWLVALIMATAAGIGLKAGGGA